MTEVLGQPAVGMMVCTCKMTHEKITEVDDDGDTIITESGWRCSFLHCCDPADHLWAHEEVNRVAGDAV
ncbi:MAG: hypothetical protein ABWY93_18675 [Mycobacterium sp.]